MTSTWNFELRKDTPNSCTEANRGGDHACASPKTEWLCWENSVYNRDEKHRGVCQISQKIC